MPTVDVWYQFEDKPLVAVKRRFKIFATGETINEGWLYVGTAVCESKHVWHLFEES